VEMVEVLKDHRTVVCRSVGFVFADPIDGLPRLSMATRRGQFCVDARHPYPSHPGIMDA